MKNGTQWVGCYEGDTVRMVLAALEKIQGPTSKFIVSYIQERLGEMSGLRQLNIKIIGPLTQYDLRRLTHVE